MEAMDAITRWDSGMSMVVWDPFMTMSLVGTARKLFDSIEARRVFRGRLLELVASTEFYMGVWISVLTSLVRNSRNWLPSQS